MFATRMFVVFAKTGKHGSNPIGPIFGSCFKGHYQSISGVIANVLLLTFLGETERVEVIISKEILHSYLKAVPREGKHYSYVFLKENSDFVRCTPSIWISRKEWEMIH